MLLLDVWREACRHIEIEQSAHRIARLLAHILPLDQLSVISFDWAHATLLPRAQGLREGIAGPLPQPRTVRASDRKLLESWTVRQEVILHQPGDDVHPVLALLHGGAIDGSWLCVPLRSEEKRTGALLLRALSPDIFLPEQRRMATSLIEPFSVALDNDCRLHELNALRETAEADKRSALARLGRDDLVTTVVGDDTGLRGVMERVSLFARSDLPVLILGETGSGKEVIARSI